MTKIVAFSGRKQSGKNTSFNFLLGLWMVRSAIVRSKVEVNEKGRLWVGDIFGDTSHAGIFDIDRNNQHMKEFRAEFIYPFVRNYSFADCLKRDVCIGLLGLSEEQCYGTDEQKGSLTHLLWENMPGVTTEKTPQDSVPVEIAGRLGKYYEKVLDGVVYHPPGPMTAREVMQFVGTEVFRKMYNNVWAQSTVNRILLDDPMHLAVITDCRFPNEVEAVRRAGGKIIRLTRNPNPADTHESETALDKDKYDWNNFDAIIDNHRMTISEQNEAVHNVLVQWEWITPMKQPEV